MLQEKFQLNADNDYSHRPILHRLTTELVISPSLNAATAQVDKDLIYQTDGGNFKVSLAMTG